MTDLNNNINFKGVPANNNYTPKKKDPEPVVKSETIETAQTDATGLEQAELIGRSLVKGIKKSVKPENIQADMNFMKENPELVHTAMNKSFDTCLELMDEDPDAYAKACCGVCDAVQARAFK